MNLLEFANPWGWWWGLAALPIIAAYTLKVRLRRQPVSTMLFWDSIFEEKKPRAWWNQLRHWISLLLQLVILLLLIGALVDPLWSWQAKQRSQLVLVVDNSASMSVAEQGQSRLAQAKAISRSLIQAMREGDQMAIITAAGRPTVAIGLTDHQPSLLQSVHDTPQTDAPNALREGVALGKRIVGDSSDAQVIVLTDGCDAAIDQLQQDPQVKVYGVGTQQDNLAITQFQVRRSLQDPGGYHVLLEVRNFGKRPKQMDLELTLEGSLVDVVPLEIDPGAVRSLHLQHGSATGGRLLAKLMIEDALAVDNQAWAILPAQRAASVTLVSAGSLFLRGVLESIALVDLEVLPSMPESVKNLPGHIWVMHQQVPESIPQGNVLVINPTQSCDLWKVGDPLETPLVSNIEGVSPITQHVQLTNVLFSGARSLTFHVEPEVLIETALDEPLLVRISRPGGDVVVLNVDLDNGELPLRIAFPVMMKNALDWFQGLRGEHQPAVATGGRFTIPLPSHAPSAEGTTPQHLEQTDRQKAEPVAERIEVVSTTDQEQTKAAWWLRSPTGRMLPVADERSKVVMSDLLESGLWALGTPDTLRAFKPHGDKRYEVTEFDKQVGEVGQWPTGLTLVACNLSNARESDLTPAASLAAPQSLQWSSIGGRAIWFYLVLFAVGLVATEWWLYQRRLVG